MLRNLIIKSLLPASMSTASLLNVNLPTPFKDYPTYQCSRGRGSNAVTIPGFTVAVSPP